MWEIKAEYGSKFPMFSHQGSSVGGEDLGMSCIFQKAFLMERRFLSFVIFFLWVYFSLFLVFTGVDKANE